MSVRKTGQPSGAGVLLIGYWKVGVVRIVAGDAKTKKNANRPPLGQSFADHNGGTNATVFVRPVKDQAAATSVPW